MVHGSCFWTCCSGETAQKSRCCIRSEGVPGKDCAMQLASKALTKKSANKSRNCKGKSLIETTAEAEDALHQVTDTHMQIQCVPVHP